MKVMVQASVEDMLRGVRGWIGDGTTAESVDRIAQMFLSINDFVLIGAAAEPGKYLFADRKTVEAIKAEATAQAAIAAQAAATAQAQAAAKAAKAKPVITKSSKPAAKAVACAQPCGCAKAKTKEAVKTTSLCRGRFGRFVTPRRTRRSCRDGGCHV